ncbi:GCN5-related N-acetyltransferase [Capnocytophaga canis]|uniref:GNAT family N-acetyltransferase n=1 Tax=Capnocytophaga canis TaxID=1848903 RepID=UPI000589A069|nr:GNAT family N-acetyltransferase [Capnocytophaga canis]CEN45675.1 GCN5-related N-acetyltransferase [Capnocytophaga canis]
MDFILSKFEDKDFEHYFQLVGDIRVMEMITERAIPLEEAKNDFDKELTKNQIHPDFGIFKIINCENQSFVGLAKLEIEASDSKEAELGYMILPEFWGKGVAGEVAKYLVDFAQNHPQIEELFAIIDPKNIPSRKILINNHFEHQEYKDFDGLPGEILRLKFRNKT